MSEEAANLLTQTLPDLDSVLLDYLVDYLRDPFSLETLQTDNGEELESLVGPALESEGYPNAAIVVDQIRDIMLAKSGNVKATNSARELDHLVTLSAFSASAGSLLPGSVDIASTTKARTTQV